MIISEDFWRVLNYCYKWGVNVCFGEPDMNHEMSDLYDAPVVGCIQWSSNTIHWPIDTTDLPATTQRILAHALLHELTHCLQEWPPDKVNEEESSMLAFEYVSARYLKLGHRTQWMTGLSGWTEMRRTFKSKLIRSSTRLAIKEKLLDENLKPTFIPMKEFGSI